MLLLKVSSAKIKPYLTKEASRLISVHQEFVNKKLLDKLYQNFSWEAT